MKDLKEYEEEASKVVKTISKAEFMSAAAKVTSEAMDCDKLDVKMGITLMLASTLIIPQLAEELFDKEEE